MCKRIFTCVLFLVLLLTRLTSELHPEENSKEGPEEEHKLTKIRKRELSAENRGKPNDDSLRNFDDWLTKKGSIRDDLLAIQAVVVKDEQAAGCETSDQKSQTRYLMCAGSILSDRYILTSASCLYEATYIRHNIKAPFAVALGLLNKSIQVIRVLDYKAHPRHQTDPDSPEHTRHNVAILKLACRIREENLRKIELPKSPLTDLCSYRSCRVAVIRKIGRTSIQMQEAPAINIPASRRRRTARNRRSEPSDNDSKIDYDKRYGKILKPAEPPIFTSEITGVRIESTSEMINYHGNRSRVIEDGTDKSGGENVSTVRTLRQWESVKGVVVPVAKDNEIRADITRSKDTRDRSEEENVKMENPSTKSAESKEAAVTGAMQNNLEESTTRRPGRSFVARSSDDPEGCPQTGSPVMFEKVQINNGLLIEKGHFQAGLVAVPCDYRQPTGRWRYTDLFENADWIEGTLKDWTYDPTKKHDNVKQDGGCSTCIFNFFINYNNYYNNKDYREPTTSQKPYKRIVVTTSPTTIQPDPSTSSATSGCLPKQDNGTRTTVISKERANARCKVTKVLVKATVIAQDVPINGDKPNVVRKSQQLLGNGRKAYGTVKGPSWYKTGSYQPAIQKKRPAIGRYYQNSTVDQLDRSYGKYFDKSKGTSRSSRDQATSEWRTRSADHGNAGPKSSTGLGQRFNIERNSPDENRRDGSWNLKRTKKRNGNSSRVDDEIVGKGASETEERDVSNDRRTESRGPPGEYKELLKSVIMEWPEVPIILSNVRPYGTAWSERIEQSDGTNNRRTITLIPTTKRNTEVGRGSDYNHAGNRDSIYRRLGVIPMGSRDPDERTKVIARSPDDEGSQDPRVNVEEANPDEFRSSNKYHRSSASEVQGRARYRVFPQGLPTSNGDVIEPRSTGTGANVVAEESLQKLERSVDRIERSEGIGIDCSNDYVDSRRTFFRNGADVRQADQRASIRENETA